MGRGEMTVTQSFYNHPRKIIPMNKHYWLVLCLCALLLQGCGNQVRVKGKVTFPDGAPLSHGSVRFQNATHMASGGIQPDGSYTLSSVGTNDGIPKGTYTVTVVAFESAGSTTGVDLEKESLPPPKSLIDLKYNSPETSGLTCDVQGATVFDIPVEPFK